MEEENHGVKLNDGIQSVVNQSRKHVTCAIICPSWVVSSTYFVVLIKGTAAAFTRICYHSIIKFGKTVRAYRKQTSLR